MEISRGAEAVLSRNGDELVKDRIKKGYRVTELDVRIRKERTRMEAKLLNEARRAGVNTPDVLSVGGNVIRMTFIDGRRMKELLNAGADLPRLAEMIGEAVAKLHSAGIVHGDLTTSNMILHGGRLYLIDFGLGFFSPKVEDQATDLAVLYEALQSTHFKHLNTLWQNILKGYGAYARSTDVLGQLEDIQKRGRYVKR